MKSKALNTVMRKAIIDQLIQVAASDKAYEAKVAKASIAMKKISEVMTPEIIETVSKLPASMAPAVAAIEMRAVRGGKLVKFNVELPTPVKLVLGTKMPDLTQAEVDMMEEFEKTIQDEESKFNPIKEKVMKALETCSTTGRLITVWPELTHLVSQLFMTTEDLNHEVPQEIIEAKEALDAYFLDGSMPEMVVSPEALDFLEQEQAQNATEMPNIQSPEPGIVGEPDSDI